VSGHVLTPTRSGRWAGGKLLLLAGTTALAISFVVVVALIRLGGLG